MRIPGALALACVLPAVGAIGGCGHAPTTGSTITSVDVAMARSQMIRVSDGQPGLVSLGAGDVLGQHIHVFDVCIAAMEFMGPEPGPIAPPENLVAWAPVGRPLSTSIALSMVALD